MILRLNSEYFLKQQKPNDRCHGDELCFLWGKKLIFNYLDVLRASKVILSTIGDLLDKQVVHSASYDILRLLWKHKVHYRVQTIPYLIK
jgi:hypothetical protein